MRCIHSKDRPRRGTLVSATGRHLGAGLFSAALLVLPLGICATPAAAATCANLATLRLPDTTITAVQSVRGGMSMPERNCIGGPE